MLLKILRGIQLCIAAFAIISTVTSLPILTWVLNLSAVTPHLWGLAAIKITTTIVLWTLYFGLGRSTKRLKLNTQHQPVKLTRDTIKAKATNTETKESNFDKFCDFLIEQGEKAEQKNAAIEKREEKLREIYDEDRRINEYIERQKNLSDKS